MGISGSTGTKTCDAEGTPPLLDAAAREDIFLLAAACAAPTKLATLSAGSKLRPNVGSNESSTEMDSKFEMHADRMLTP